MMIRVNGSCGSLTLDQIAVTNGTQSHVFIEIKISQLQLTGRVVFEHHESLIITSENTVISCTERNSGLVFIDINRVTISDVTMTNCGTCGVNSSYHYRYVYTVCLHHSGDISITNISITKNEATALSILDHQGGTVNISSSNFTENIITDADEDMYAERLRGGGGIFIGNYKSDPSSAAVYHFENCLFARNVPHTTHHDSTMVLKMDTISTSS